MPLSRLGHFTLSCWFKITYKSYFGIVALCERISTICLHRGTHASTNYLLYKTRYVHGVRPNTRRN